MKTGKDCPSCNGTWAEADCATRTEPHKFWSYWVEDPGEFKILIAIWEEASRENGEAWISARFGGPRPAEGTPEYRTWQRIAGSEASRRDVSDWMLANPKPTLRGK